MCWSAQAVYQEGWGAALPGSSVGGPTVWGACQLCALLRCADGRDPCSRLWRQLWCTVLLGVTLGQRRSVYCLKNIPGTAAVTCHVWCAAKRASCAGFAWLSVAAHLWGGPQVVCCCSSWGPLPHNSAAHTCNPFCASASIRISTYMDPCQSIGTCSCLHKESTTCQSKVDLHTAKLEAAARPGSRQHLCCIYREPLCGSLPARKLLPSCTRHMYAQVYTSHVRSAQACNAHAGCRRLHLLSSAERTLHSQNNQQCRHEPQLGCQHHCTHSLFLPW
jgi:hypothetical protein